MTTTVFIGLIVMHEIIPMFILPLNFSEDLKRPSKNDAMINTPC
jgi:hypothetical protein